MTEHQRRHDASRPANLRSRRVTLSQLLGPAASRPARAPRRATAGTRLLRRLAPALTCVALIVLAVGTAAYLSRSDPLRSGGQPPAAIAAAGPTAPPMIGQPPPARTPEPGSPPADEPDAAPHRFLVPEPVVDRSRMIEPGTPSLSTRSASPSLSRRFVPDSDAPPSQDADTEPDVRDESAGSRDERHSHPHSHRSSDGADDRDDDQAADDPSGHDTCEGRYDNGSDDGPVSGHITGCLEELLGQALLENAQMSSPALAVLQPGFLGR